MMKKISLKNLNLKEVEQLSREQLKNVLGGGGTGTDTEHTDPPPKCNCSTRDTCENASTDPHVVCSSWCDSTGNSYSGHCDRQ